ncbi:MAG: 1,4-alpha-glucan branching protein GlgB [Erysipelotrichaceae bacterium]|nr:1,4-alpha-glucan branching protein GlgB [Erysipelotrichaceae bacterium]
MNPRLIQEFHEGRCLDAWRVFGAHTVCEEGRHGVRFTVYAPAAAEISVIGSFNDWRPDEYRMQRTEAAGIWSLFIPDIPEGASYKYCIRTGDGSLRWKADPYAFFSEVRPESASRVWDPGHLSWSDEEWMKTRTRNFDRPMSIYEVFAGGWKSCPEQYRTYRMLEEELIPYVLEHGYTHIELMPLNEYPFDGSWGYQPSGYYAMTSRYGSPEEAASFFNACHRAGIGIIMDFVPVHFVKDDFGLRLFDGSPLYEYPSEMDASTEWGTLYFDLWREEVRSFLMSAASFWLEVYHIDGIRVDAVSNMIYWGGNSNRGANEGALNFMKRMNWMLHERYPQVMMIAEDSSAYAKVTHGSVYGGLEFDYKWDLGWMNDTLKYYELDPVYRKWHHNKITFSMAYYWSERFMLTLSHDENVHGKKTMVDRMWGSYEDKFAQVKNLYMYMFAHPGKKLNFMGNELASFREFDEIKELDWFLLQYPRHDSFLRFFTDLNHVYRDHPCMWKYDFREDFGFRWVDPDDAEHSVYSFYREDENEYVLCVLNMTPVMREGFPVSVPQGGWWKELLNSEQDIYNGCGRVNERTLRTYREEYRGFAHRIRVDLAPFAGIWLYHRKGRKQHV